MIQLHKVCLLEALPAAQIQPATPMPRWLPWLCMAAVLGGSIGLVRSLSRGAWLGTAFGLGWHFCSLAKPRIQDLKHRAASGDRLARRHWRLLRISAVAVLLCAPPALWVLKDVQNPWLRRLGTVANRTDLSWRNRVTAWNGAAQATLARPLAGWGLAKVEIVYREQYAPKSLKETAAIQLNDYLHIAAGWGLPALVCLCICLWGRLAQTLRQGSPLLPPLLLLLIGAWFDGVQFRLALAVPFWLLLAALPGTDAGQRTMTKPR